MLEIICPVCKNIAKKAQFTDMHHTNIITAHYFCGDSDEEHQFNVNFVGTLEDHNQQYSTFFLRFNIKNIIFGSEIHVPAVHPVLPNANYLPQIKIYLFKPRYYKGNRIFESKEIVKIHIDNLHNEGINLLDFNGVFSFLKEKSSHLVKLKAFI